MSERTCEWCREEIGSKRGFTRVFVMPKEYGERKLYFHERHLQPFKDANPNIMRQKEQEALQANSPTAILNDYESMIAKEKNEAVRTFVEGNFPTAVPRLSESQLEHLESTARWRPSLAISDHEPRIFREAAGVPREGTRGGTAEGSRGAEADTGRTEGCACSAANAQISGGRSVGTPIGELIWGD